MRRPDKDTYFLAMAALVSSRATCLRRQVGAVAVNAKGHVLSTGYNGVAAGEPHCNEYDASSEVRFPHACEGASAPSGTNLDGCQALHAEWNMLLQCRDPWEIDTVYCTTSPCTTCRKLLMNTSCRRIVFIEAYLDANDNRLAWEKSRGVGAWIQLALPAFLSSK